MLTIFWDNLRIAAQVRRCTDIELKISVRVRRMTETEAMGTE
jgi:hypothetical protein